MSLVNVKKGAALLGEARYNNIPLDPRMDPTNKIQREINGCKILLQFARERNEDVERAVLDNLIGVFERKVQGLSSMKH